MAGHVVSGLRDTVRVDPLQVEIAFNVRSRTVWRDRPSRLTVVVRGRPARQRAVGSGAYPGRRVRFFVFGTCSASAPSADAFDLAVLVFPGLVFVARLYAWTLQP
jgi:hypothetical protein